MALRMMVLILSVLLTVPTAGLTAPTQRPGGTVVYAIDEDADRLDSNLSSRRNSQIVFFQILEPLIVRDERDNKFKPWLATSWDISPDGKTYTFKLRRDVKFHDGTPFDAEAVKFNMDRTHDPDIEKLVASRCAGCARGFYRSTEVVDPFTVRIRLETQWAPFLNSLSLFYRMVSPTAVKKVGHVDFGRQPVGTGPFRFVEWIPNNRIGLERNPDYAWPSQTFKHSGPALLDRVIFRIIPEAPTRVAALEAGEVHISTLIPSQDFQRLQRDSRFRPTVGLVPGVPFAFAMNTTKAPTDELAVRRALNHGIDREIMAKAVFGAFQRFGAFRPAYTVLSPVTWAYDKSTEIYDYDPERAQALLNEAGWKVGSDGFRQKGGLPLEVVLTSWEHGAPELMQVQLRRIGVSLKIRIIDASAGNEAQRKRETHMSPVPAARTDPDILSVLLHSRNCCPDLRGGVNFSFVKNPTLDTLLDQAATEVNDSRRRRLYVQIVRLVMENAYMLPVYTYDNVALASVKVQDLRLDVAGLVPWLYDVWLSP